MGLYVEDMISLLNPTWERAVEWTSWDFETASGPSGRSQAGGGQADWPQKGPSAPSFDIADRKGFFGLDNGFVTQAGRYADVYVFAWHGLFGDDCDHRDKDQWEFYVVPTSALPPGQKTIGLAGIPPAGGAVPTRPGGCHGRMPLRQRNRPRQGG